MTFTPKDKIRVMVCTSLYRIEGEMYVLPGSRLTDIMNVKAKDFIPITNAVFRHPYDNKVFSKSSFTVINRDSILMIFPVEDTGAPGPDEAD
jgi:uncharacterized RmlC-like cupin family protein